MASFKATWLGDGDPNAQIIHVGGLRFIRGEATTVPADHEMAEMLKGNPAFSTEGKAETAQVEEPTDEEQQANADQGTEKGALKAQLRARGVEVKGNPSVETLRTRLADATKDETALPPLGMPGNALGR